MSATGVRPPAGRLDLDGEAVGSRQMRVLIVHNWYRLPGGEDRSVSEEVELLTVHGHQVALLEADNTGLSAAGAVLAGLMSVWNPAAYRRARQLIRRFRPEVASVHNVIPQLSPSVYYAARVERVPIVQTLHNFRLLCPAATMMRNGTVCESCLGRTLAWPGIAHACYRGSRPATAAVASTTAVHAVLGTWQRRIALYIALTEFARHRFIEHGLPANRITVKPTCLLKDPGPGGGGESILFVGRLAPEKGLGVLLEAWKQLAPGPPLVIVGDGPLRPDLERTCRAMDGVQLLGWRSAAEIVWLMQSSRLLVVPSLWYEGLPRTVIEAFATGLPVIASSLGSLAEVVADGRTGRLFRPGDAEDLAAKIDWALSNPGELAHMRQAARAEYEAKYTAQRNYELLMEIFRRAIAAQTCYSDTCSGFR